MRITLKSKRTPEAKCIKIDNAFLPSGKLFSIHELLEQIYQHNGPAGMRTMRLVCRHWKRLDYATFTPKFACNCLDPFQWRQLSLSKSSMENATLLNQYGSFVQDLKMHDIIPNNLQLVSLTCSNLMSIHMYVSADSLGTSYVSLERFFISLQPAPITNIYIRFDLCYFDPNFFWSLSQLSRIEKLTLDLYISRTYYRKQNNSSIFASFLECCPTVHEIAILFPYDEEIDSAVSIIDRFRESLATTFVPKTIPEVLARRTQYIIDKDLDQNSTNGSHATNSTPPKEYQLRRMNLCHNILDMPTLLQILEKSPYLEELNMLPFTLAILPNTWTTLSTFCPQLRILHVQINNYDRNPYAISEYLALFPQLHTLKLIFFNVLNKSDIPSLKFNLQRYGETNGTQRPFKHLHLIGDFHDPYEALKLALTQCPIEFETLVVGPEHGKNFGPDVGCPSSTSLLDWTLPIRCQDTLQHLVISGVEFPDQSVTVQFFTRLQEFTRLQSLQMSIQHLRDLISDSPNPRKNAIGGYYYASQDKNRGVIEGFRPYLNLCFPTIQSMTLRCVYNSSGSYTELYSPHLELFECRLLVGACPSLKKLDLSSTVAWNAWGYFTEFLHLGIRA
ncbi:hypothetical protein FBU30_004102 [Linnemannia zychae]|nr:hypothetical protein FBU30_004102 [Linnemannia zychae]